MRNVDTLGLNPGPSACKAGPACFVPDVLREATSGRSWSNKRRNLCGHCGVSRQRWHRNCNTQGAGLASSRCRTLCGAVALQTCPAMARLMRASAGCACGSWMAVLACAHVSACMVECTFAGARWQPSQVCADFAGVWSLPPRCGSSRHQPGPHCRRRRQRVAPMLAAAALAAAMAATTATAAVYCCSAISVPS